jgi:ABC-type multidrug transport system ATPase subunit
VAIIHHGKILFKGSIDEVVGEVLDYSLVELETSPLSSQTIQQLKEIPEVTQVKLAESDKMDTTAIEITVCKHDRDIRPLIADIIVKSGAKLYTIKQGENMLEKAYIEALKETKGGKL